MNLYYLTHNHRKHSVLRSAEVTNYFAEGFRVISVEPYDDTGVNALDSTPSRYDAALNTIEKAVIKVFPHETVRMCIYSNTFDVFEYLFDTSQGPTGSFKI